MRRPAEAAHAGLQLDTLRRRAQRDRRNLVLELLHERPARSGSAPGRRAPAPPGASAGRTTRSHQRATLNALAHGKRSRMLYWSKNSELQPSSTMSIPGCAGGPARRTSSASVGTSFRVRSTPSFPSDVLKLGREAGGGGILLRVRERELERLRREDLCLEPWRGDRGRAGHRRWNPPGRAGRNAAHGALHEPARLRIGERRAPRHEPEEAARQCRECSPGGRLRSRRDPGEPRCQDAARQHSVHPVVRGREDELPRLDRAPRSSS